MAVPDGGPIDDCVRDGAWDPELQLAHGGPLPFLSCSRGSRGVVESWPYVLNVKAKKWGNAIAHGIYKPTVVDQTEQLLTSTKREVGSAILSACEVDQPQCGAKARDFIGEDFSDMDWTVGRGNLLKTEKT